MLFKESAYWAWFQKHISIVILLLSIAEINKVLSTWGIK